MNPVVASGAAVMFVLAALIIGLCVGLAWGYRTGFRDGRWSGTHTALRRRDRADRADRPPGYGSRSVW